VLETNDGFQPVAARDLGDCRPDCGSSPRDDNGLAIGSPPRDDNGLAIGSPPRDEDGPTIGSFCPPGGLFIDIAVTTTNSAHADTSSLHDIVPVFIAKRRLSGRSGVIYSRRCVIPQGVLMQVGRPSASITRQA